MTVRDIIYLDNNRLTSFLSQIMGGVAEGGTERHTDGLRGERTLLSDEKTLGHTTSHEVQKIREVRYFDHLLSQFLEEVDSSIVLLSEVNLPETVTNAFTRGRLVRVDGPLFLDDTELMAKQLEAAPTYIQVGEQASKLGASDTSHRGGEAERLRAKRASQPLRDLQELLPKIGQSLNAIRGEAAVCGVQLGQTTIRGLLIREWLREDMDSLIGRYGTRSSARFSVIGTVTKVSLGQAGGDAIGQGPPETDHPSEIRAAFKIAMKAVDNIREQLADTNGRSTVLIAPLVVFRELDIKAR